MLPHRVPTIMCRSFLAVVYVAGFWVHAAPAWCQQTRYQELTLSKKFETRSKINGAKLAKAKILKGKEDSRAKEILTDYYKNFFFRALTLSEYASQLGTMRLELQKDLANAVSEEARRHVVEELAYKFGLAIAASDRFHPGARYTAMMIVGDLNQQEEVISGSNSRPPVPLEKALGQLVRRYKDEKMMDAVRVAALLGIQRHASLRSLPNAPKPLTGPQREGLIKLALQLAVTEEVPAGRSQEGHDWMRRRAVDILGALRSPGADGKVAQQLISFLTDENASIKLRSAAADALAKLRYAEDNQPDAGQLANKMGLVALALCDAEFDELVKLKTQSGFGGRGGMMGDMQPRTTPRMRPSSEFRFPGEGGDVVEDEPTILDPQTEPARRRLMTGLLTIKTALNGDARMGIPGIKSLPNGDVAVPPIVSAIDEVLAAANDIETPLNDFGAALRKQKNALATMLGVTVKDDSDELGGDVLETPASEEPASEAPEAPAEEFPDELPELNEDE